MANAKDDSDINQREDSILKYIENNNVEYALNKAEALCSEFTNLKTLLIQWKSSHTGIEEKKKANVVDDNILSREERGIKYSFSKTIQEFQDEKLPKYFDLKPFDQEMDSIKNQETLMLKIMEQRLEPMGFTIPETKDENIGHHPQQVIYGSSSIAIPLTIILNLAKNSHYGQPIQTQVIRLFSRGQSLPISSGGQTVARIGK